MAQKRKTSNGSFGKPILNSPYEYTSQHWELDEAGLAMLLSALDDSERCLFAALKVSANPVERSLPILDGVELKNRFHLELGLNPL